MKRFTQNMPKLMLSRSTNPATITIAPEMEAPVLPRQMMRPERAFAA
mgnify:CR=1 FL=1